MLSLVAALAFAVVDGDTLLLNKQKIRLYGIDAPELAQACKQPDGTPYRCGSAARSHLVDLVAARPVACTQEHLSWHDQVDRYGRQIAVCFAGADAASLNEQMVRDGYALAYRHYSLAFVPAESAARRSERGLWQGSFEAPWTWRHAHPR